MNEKFIPLNIVAKNLGISGQWIRNQINHGNPALPAKRASNGRFMVQPQVTYEYFRAFSKRGAAIEPKADSKVQQLGEAIFELLVKAGYKHNLEIKYKGWSIKAATLDARPGAVIDDQAATVDARPGAVIDDQAATVASEKIARNSAPTTPAQEKTPVAQACENRYAIALRNSRLSTL